MKTLLILLLFTFSCYAGKGHDFEENPGNADPPTDECAFCDDEAPIPQGIYWFAAGVLFL